MSNLSTKSSNSMEVKILELQETLKKILDAYLQAVCRFRSPKTKLLNSKYKSYRPWLIEKADGTITLDYDYLNKNLNTTEINQISISSLLEDDIKKSKLAAKKIEKILFSSVTLNTNNVPANSNLSIIALNNGELQLMINNLSKQNQEFTEVITKKQGFSKNIEAIATAKQVNSFNGIHVISERQLIFNPGTDLDDTAKSKALEAINNTYKVMNEMPKQLYRILVDNYIRVKSNGLLDNKSNAYISLDDIHFKYRNQCGVGENKSSTPTTMKSVYMEAVRELGQYTIGIDFTNTPLNKSFIKYRPIKNAKKVISDSKLLLVSSVIYSTEEENKKNDSKVIGFYYQLGEIGDIYLDKYKEITQYNYAYPKLALSIDPNNYAAAVNVCEYIAHEHRNRLKKKDNILNISISKLIEISKTSFDATRFKRSIDRFLNRQLKKVSEVLIESKTIKSMDYPEEIPTSQKKFLDNIYVKIELNYDDNSINTIKKV